ncbi:unnamed protein product [Jaminaea pallidilutea]
MVPASRTWSLELDRAIETLKRGDVSVHPTAALLAIGLAVHGLRKDSLCKSGALTALLVGYATMANPLPVFGVTLIVFYLTGSKATKVKADVKAKLEIEAQQSHSHSHSSRPSASSSRDAPGTKHKSASGGGRDGWQVLCNGLTGCLAAAVFRYDLWATSTKLDSHCTMSTAQQTLKNCLLVALAHFAACMGDTLASELGILSSRKPFLLFSARPRVVPPGTNGGISLLGTVCSALGGLWIGFVFTASLLAFNPACRPQAATSIVPRLLILATLSGLGGSMIDSLLGAMLQKTWYNVKTKQVLVGTRRLRRKEDDDDQWQVITGYDVLTNNQVNFISSALTCLVVVFIDRSW